MNKHIFLAAAALVTAGSLTEAAADGRRTNTLAGDVAVRHRRLLVAKRFELVPLFESTINADFRHIIGGGAKLEYHLGDMFSVGVIGVASTALDTKLVDKIVGVLDAGDLSKDDLRKKLLGVANGKLIRLHAVATRTKEAGGHDKLAATIADKLKRSKDKDYVNKLGEYSNGRLLDMLTVAERAQAAAVAAGPQLRDRPAQGLRRRRQPRRDRRRRGVAGRQHRPRCVRRRQPFRVRGGASRGRGAPSGDKLPL